MLDKVRIEFGGEIREFAFGIGFIGGIIDALDCNVGEIEAKIVKNPWRTWTKIMHESLKWHYEMEDELCPFKYPDIVRWVELSGGISSENVIKFISAMNESMGKFQKNKKPLASTRSRSATSKKK